MKRHKALISILNVDLTNGSGVTCGRGGEVCRGGSGGGGRHRSKGRFIHILTDIGRRFSVLYSVSIDCINCYTCIDVHGNLLSFDKKHYPYIDLVIFNLQFKKFGSFKL